MRRAVTFDILGAQPKKVHSKSTLTPVVLVADPPWQSDDKLGKRGASDRYRCLSEQQLLEFPIPDVGPDAVLFLWKIESMAEQAYRLARAWGFTPKAGLTWQKLTKHGKPHFGLGRYTRGTCEHVIIATRGRAFPVWKGQRSIFEASMPLDAYGKIEHSAKPDEFYAIVERMYSTSVKHELFARKVRAGWQQQGKELGRL